MPRRLPRAMRGELLAKSEESNKEKNISVVLQVRAACTSATCCALLAWLECAAAEQLAAN
ncbi:MAG: hypothetical protein ACLT4C_03545 [Butyricicoccus sp.]